MRKSRFVARGGLMAAATMVLLWLAAAFPFGQVGACAAAGVLLAMPLSRAQVAFSGGVYGVSMLVGWILVPRKSVMLLYTAFGLYSFIKYAAEGPRRRVLEWSCKLTFCNLSLLFAIYLIQLGLFPATQIRGGLWFVCILLACNLAFVACDITFSKLIGLLRRIFPSG